MSVYSRPINLVHTGSSYLVSFSAKVTSISNVENDLEETLIRFGVDGIGSTPLYGCEARLYEGDEATVSFSMIIPAQSPNDIQIYAWASQGADISFDGTITTWNLTPIASSPPPPVQPPDSGSNVESIEILNGPSSVEFGTNGRIKDVTLTAGNYNPTYNNVEEGRVQLVRIKASGATRTVNIPTIAKFNGGANSWCTSVRWSKNDPTFDIEDGNTATLSFMRYGTEVEIAIAEMV
jgi:hypothetical protein